ncbi:MAG: hypothetical protein ONB12_00740, partial [candidate division KSB1 bacterium]|nr:hypothetical protein [candidate division KSB1 bacterium]
MKIALFVLLSALFFVLRANSYVVTHTGDDGAGSLRWALQAANSHSGADTVFFQLKRSDAGYRAQGDFWQIELRSPLPSLTDDGLTLIGTAAAGDRPAVLVYGGALPVGSIGWTITSSRNRILGVAFAGFRGTILWLRGTSASNNRIEGCFFGILPDGFTAVNDPQTTSLPAEQSRGVYLSQGCRNNLIRRNIISNMFFEAVLIEAAHSNILEENLIGVLKDGVTPLGNGWINIPRYEIENQKIKRFAGVRVSNGSRGNRIGPGNVICASGRAGIHIEGAGTDSTRVIGNLLGLGADGESHADCGNAEAGLKVQRGPRYTIIGGVASGEGNVVSANYSSGIQIRENVTETVLAGNKIGVNASGTRPAPNAHNGIYFFGQKEYGYPQRNRVGPANVIICNGYERENEPYAGTWAAVRLDSVGTAFNEIFENFIGRNADGTVDGSANSGIIIGSGAHDNTVGPNNFFGRHRKYGIWIRQAGSVRNRISRNRYSDDPHKAIALEAGGNQMVSPPELFIAANGVRGTALPRAWIECYDAHTMSFLAAMQADAGGRFFCPLEMRGSVVALQTDEAGNSSPFSSSLMV